MDLRVVVRQGDIPNFLRFKVSKSLGWRGANEVLAGGSRGIQYSPSLVELRES